MPVCFSFILSNKCCNLWVTFWEPCYKNLSETGQKHTFDVIQTKFPFEMVLDHDVICGPKLNINSIEFDKCTRAVFHIISDLGLHKLRYSGVVFPIVSFMIRTFKIAIGDYHSCDILKAKDEEHRFYTSLFKYIIYLILFGFGCPLIIVFVYVSVFFHLIHLLVLKIYLNVKFTTSDYSYSVNVLYFVLLLHHLLILIFWISNDFVLPYIMITSIFIHFYSFMNSVSTSGSTGLIFVTPTESTLSNVSTYSSTFSISALLSTISLSASTGSTSATPEASATPNASAVSTRLLSAPAVSTSATPGGSTSCNASTTPNASATTNAFTPPPYAYVELSNVDTPI